MKMLLLMLLTLTLLSVSAQEYNSSSYDPAAILSNLFNMNTETLQRNFDKQDTVAFAGASENKYAKYSDNSINDFESLHYQGSLKKKRRRLRNQRQSGYYGFQRPHGHDNEAPQLPAFASEAVSRVTEALTSIALYDDYQCVPRLLCEAAEGGALGSNNLLESVTGLQPLLTLLSAFGGVSSNPLFVFGRAVFLGMSKGNVGTCRYAYPLCPTDPEQLVYYLNNHNGGFFRFFNAQKEQQNLEQFYNGLSQNFANDNTQSSGYGFYRPNVNYGYQTNYGSAYPYNGYIEDQYNNNGVLKKIEKRIQNKPNSNVIENSDSNRDSKWIFPENYEKYIDNENTFNVFKIHDKAIHFPDTGNEKTNELTKDSSRIGKGFAFPNNFNNNQYYYNNNYVRGPKESISSLFSNLNKDYLQNNYLHKETVNNYNKNYRNDNSYTTVYVVRGNGDPSKPEIIKLRPGEVVH